MSADLGTGDGTIQTVLRDGVLHVILSRPRVRNALRNEEKRALTAIFEGPEARTARCVILTSEPGEPYCAGTDLNELVAMDQPQLIAMLDLESRLYDAIMACPALVVSAVHGWALGTGCLLSLVSDLTIADTTARFGQPEVLNGAPTPIHAALLPAAIGIKRAAWLVLTGRFIDAQTAADWGLVNQVVEQGADTNTAEALATDISDQAASYSFGLQKRIVDCWKRYPFDAAVEASKFITAASYSSPWPRSAASRMKQRELKPTGKRPAAAASKQTTRKE